ncbi:hypothetical protein ACSBR2_038576 [Camellia fascicularis]
MEQGTVTSLIEESGKIKEVEYKTHTGQQFSSYAPLTIVCDGCFSNLRRFLCKPKVDMISYFIGLIMECELPYPNHANLVLDGPTIMLFYPVSSTEVRCLIDFPTPGTLPSISNGEMAQYLKTVVAPQIPPELYNAFILSVDKGEIRTMPINSMPATPYLIPGAVLLGDALNMRHAGTGSGMMVALHDIVLLRDLLRPLQNQLTATAALTKCLQLFYTKRKAVAFTVNTTAGALIKVNHSEAKDEIQELGFEYLRLGQFFCRGPVGILSGVDLHPLNMAFYAFAVALYITCRSLLPIPSPKALWAAARLILGTSIILFPILLDGVKEWLFSTTHFQPHELKTPPFNGEK